MEGRWQWKLLYGPIVLTGFFLLLLCPPPLLLFISHSSRPWRGWHVARGGGKDGSSARCKSLPPGKPAPDARPHGPLTCCLRDLWRLGACGHCRLHSSLSSVSLHTHCRIARSRTPCTTIYRSIQRGIPCTCWAAARSCIHAPLPTLSHTKINTPINISTLQHRVLQSHHRRPGLLSVSIWRCVDYYQSWCVSCRALGVAAAHGQRQINGSALSNEVMFLFSHGLRAISSQHISADSTHRSASTLQ